MSKLLYGKNNTEGIVDIKKAGEGKMRLTFVDGSTQIRRGPIFDPRHGIYQPVDYFMIKEGYTFFKGIKPSDLPILSFDIETTGLTFSAKSSVLLISNTFRDRNGKLTRKLFCVDDYPSSKSMILAWEAWIFEIQPAVIIGHNILGFDLPYMRHCCGGFAAFEQSVKESEFRKDGSQSYTYKDFTFIGAQIIDTMFLAIKSDIGRKYDSYGLKNIIRQEGLERKNRQHYDASQIAKNWDNPEERAKIKEYAEHDADDALAIYDLLISPWFYYAQMIPMPFQRIINTSSGRQLNNIMMRAYMQDGRPVPAPSPRSEYEGAISIGNPGVYKNVYKVDVASLYPSIIRQDKLYPKTKDPDGYFLQLVETLTKQRLINKAKAKQTGERYYKDLEQSQKLIINSAYGFLGAEGLNFNEPKIAAYITRRGREILTQAIEWAEKQGFTLVNADTDSISFTINDDTDSISFTNGKKIDDVTPLIQDLNSGFPPLIRWEDDGGYSTVIVIAAKNYVLELHNGNLQYKGASLKAPYKEPALRAFLQEAIKLLINGNEHLVNALYDDVAAQIADIKDITPWCVKKTVTKAILNPERANESRVLDALDVDTISEGDKVHVFYESKDVLATRENFKGLYDKDRLYSKLHATIKILSPVLDISAFKNFTLKRNVQSRPIKRVHQEAEQTHV